jgi:hypothetical protein
MIFAIMPCSVDEPKETTSICLQSKAGKNIQEKERIIYCCFAENWQSRRWQFSPSL